ncbi:helix-turn-helix domain-containing protein [Streptomyces albireticuli]|uniref:Transcriptional regulator n=1 Tax=Streptomyces albireticuli TaxID=1940 RepID=A0A2A2CZ68_9ACTN|nr:helix-turn-helix transcriptional regulator [Streptomyces albireticuli]MCD9145791.1 helix-turn-helix transcriptional regulator [Streptomyces albireticuli]MCD9165868.1 helix-turn-helix transcriptional regulator [Streptomyces albireticuli]MCD9194453.1 helix-turn-helix transcriptional regulator [Streptomyces albireticuli]PAU44555.1 transcriptional regulator [Streptomyces albireticuli]
MSNDFQQARVTLGARMRELRTEAGLNGKEAADALSWAPSKVSRLENGKQTPTAADLDAWAVACGQPETAGELKGRLRGLETRYRTWRRQLAGGHRPRQEAGIEQTQRTGVTRSFEAGIVPGILQTADYARHVLTRYGQLRSTPRDVEPAVNARMQRQAALYEAGKRFDLVVWEAALYVLLCPREVMAAQLDRLISVAGLSNVTLGIIPLGAQMNVAPGDGFSVYDERLVISETWTVEMWLDDPDEIAMFLKIWETLRESAVYDHQAHRLLARARAALDLS